MKLHIPKSLYKCLLAALLAIPALTYNAAQALTTDHGTISSQDTVYSELLGATGVTIERITFTGTGNEIRSGAGAVTITGTAGLADSVLGDNNYISALTSIQQTGNTLGNENTYSAGSSITFTNSDLAGDNNELTAAAGTITGINLIKGDGNELSGAYGVSVGGIVGDDTQLNTTAAALNLGDGDISISSIAADNTTANAFGDITVAGSVAGLGTSLTSTDGSIKTGDILNTAPISPLDPEIVSTGRLVATNGSITVGEMAGAFFVNGDLSVSTQAITGDRNDIDSKGNITTNNQNISGDNNDLTSTNGTVEAGDISGDDNTLSSTARFVKSAEITGNNNTLTSTDGYVQATNISGNDNTLSSINNIVRAGDITGTGNELSGKYGVSVGDITGDDTQLNTTAAALNLGDGDISISSIAADNTTANAFGDITVAGSVAGLGTSLTSTDGSITAGSLLNTAGANPGDAEIVSTGTLTATKGSITVDVVEGTFVINGGLSVSTQAITGDGNDIDSEGNITTNNQTISGNDNTLTSANNIVSAGDITGTGNELSGKYGVSVGDITGDDTQLSTTAADALLGDGDISISSIAADNTTANAFGDITVAGSVAGLDTSLTSTDGSITAGNLLNTAGANLGDPEIVSTGTLTATNGSITVSVIEGTFVINGGLSVTTQAITGDGNDIDSEGNITTSGYTISGNNNDLTSTKGTIEAGDISGDDNTLSSTTRFVKSAEITGNNNTLTSTDGYVQATNISGNDNTLSSINNIVRAGDITGTGNELSGKYGVSVADITGNDTQLNTTAAALNLGDGDISISSIAADGTTANAFGDITVAGSVAGLNTSLTSTDGSITAGNLLNSAGANPGDPEIVSTGTLTATKGSITVGDIEGTFTLEALVGQITAGNITGDDNNLSAGNTIDLGTSSITGDNNTLTAKAGDITLSKVTGDNNTLRADAGSLIADSISGAENEVIVDGDVSLDTLSGSEHRLTSFRGNVSISDLDDVKGLYITALSGDTTFSSGNASGVDIGSLNFKTTTTPDKILVLTDSKIYLIGKSEAFNATSTLKLNNVSVTVESGTARAETLILNGGSFSSLGLTVDNLTLSNGATLTGPSTISELVHLDGSTMGDATGFTDATIINGSTAGIMTGHATLNSKLTATTSTIDSILDVNTVDITGGSITNGVSGADSLTARAGANVGDVSDTIYIKLADQTIALTITNATTVEVTGQSETGDISFNTAALTSLTSTSSTHMSITDATRVALYGSSVTGDISITSPSLGIPTIVANDNTHITGDINGYKEIDINDSTVTGKILGDSSGAELTVTDSTVTDIVTNIATLTATDATIKGDVTMILAGQFEASDSNMAGVSGFGSADLNGGIYGALIGDSAGNADVEIYSGAKVASLSTVNDVTVSNGEVTGATSMTGVLTSTNGVLGNTSGFTSAGIVGSSVRSLNGGTINISAASTITHDITSSDKISITQSTAKGNVTGTGYISIVDSIVGGMENGIRSTLTSTAGTIAISGGSTINSNIETQTDGKGVNIQDSRIKGDISSAGGAEIALGTVVEGSITAAGDITLSDSTAESTITTTAGTVTVKDADVQGMITANTLTANTADSIVADVNVDTLNITNVTLTTGEVTANTLNITSGVLNAVDNNITISGVTTLNNGYVNTTGSFSSTKVIFIEQDSNVGSLVVEGAPGSPDADNSYELTRVTSTITDTMYVEDNTTLTESSLTVLAGGATIGKKLTQDNSSFTVAGGIKIGEGVELKNDSLLDITGEANITGGLTVEDSQVVSTDTITMVGGAFSATDASVDAKVLGAESSTIAGTVDMKYLSTGSLDVLAGGGFTTAEGLDANGLISIDSDITASTGNISLTHNEPNHAASTISADITSLAGSISLDGAFTIGTAIAGQPEVQLSADTDITIASDAVVFSENARFNANDEIKLAGYFTAGENVQFGTKVVGTGELLKEGGDSLSLLTGSDLSGGEVYVYENSTLDAAKDTHLGTLSIDRGSKLIVANSGLDSIGTVNADKVIIEDYNGTQNTAPTLVFDIDLTTLNADMLNATEMELDGTMIRLDTHNGMSESAIADQTRVLIGTGEIADGQEASEYIDHDLVSLNAHLITTTDASGTEQLEVLLSKNYIGAGKTSNQTATSSALQGIVPKEVEGSQLGDVLSALGETRSEADALRALDSLSGRGHAGLNKLVIEGSMNHLQTLRNTQKAVNEGLVMNYDINSGQLINDDPSRAISIQYTGGNTDLSDDGNGGTFNTTRQGFILVGAKKVTREWVIGYDFAYSHETARSAEVDLTSDSFYADINATHTSHRLSQYFSLGAAMYGLDTARNIVVSAPGFSQYGRAKGTTTAAMLNVSYEATYEFRPRESRHNYSGVAVIDASFGTVDGFQEKGFGNAGLDVSYDDITNVTVGAGMRYTFNYELYGKAGFISADALFVVNAGNTDLSVTNRFIGGGASFQQTGTESGRGGLRLNASGTLPITERWSAVGQVNSEFRPDESSYSGSVGVKYAF